MSKTLLSLSLLFAACASAQTYQANWDSLDRPARVNDFETLRIGV